MLNAKYRSHSLILTKVPESCTRLIFKKEHGLFANTGRDSNTLQPREWCDAFVTKEKVAVQQHFYRYFLPFVYVVEA